MKVITDSIEIHSKGNSDIIDITSQVSDCIQKHGFKEGQVTVFVSGATGGITTIEYEPGLVRDFPDALERLAPEGMHYHHNATWGDGNGHSHVRASFIGPSLTVPFSEGRMLLGTWQQIIVIDCDTRSRNRRIVIQMIGVE